MIAATSQGRCRYSCDCDYAIGDDATAITIVIVGSDGTTAINPRDAIDEALLDCNPEAPSKPEPPTFERARSRHGHPQRPDAERHRNWSAEFG